VTVQAVPAALTEGHSSGAVVNGLNGERLEEELDRRVTMSVLGLMTAELLKTLVTVARRKNSRTPKTLGVV
jgi:hypothetical protein